MEEQEKQDKMIRKLKKQLKLYMKKVEEYEGNCFNNIMFKGHCIDNTALCISMCNAASAQLKPRTSTVNAPAITANITRKEKEYQGMLKYKQGDETKLLKNLVTGKA